MMNVIPHRAKVKRPDVMTLGALAEMTGSTLRGDPNVEITGVGTILSAKEGEITFLSDAKFRSMLATSHAAAIILTEELSEACQTNALICKDPKLTFARIVEKLYPNKMVQTGCHPSAVIGENSDIHPSSHIGPFCVIGDRVKIGANVVLQAGCTVGDDSVIEEGSVLYPRVTVYQS